jgi:serine/threonine protein kinase
MNKDYASYWEAVEAEECSSDFKDLAQKLLAHDPEERPSFEKLKSHPWVTAQGSESDKALKQTVAEKIMKLREEKRSERQKHAASKGYQNKEYRRGDDDEETCFIEEAPFTHSYKNSNLTEWGTVLKAAEMWDKIEEFTAETGQAEAQRDEDKKKFMLVNEEKGMNIKVKFFDCKEEATLKISFVKKSGDLVEYYAFLKEMQSFLDEHLVTMAGSE